MLVLQSFLAGETQHLPFPSWQKSGEFFFPYIFLRYVFVLLHDDACVSKVVSELK